MAVEMIYKFGNYIRNKEKCFYCGKGGEKLTKDHFYPKSKGGYFTVYACKDCNTIKANRTPEEFVLFLAQYVSLDVKKRDRMINATISLMDKSVLTDGFFSPNIISKGLAFEISDKTMAVKLSEKTDGRLVETTTGTYIVLLSCKYNNFKSSK